MYGIWDNVNQRFVLGIKESTTSKALIKFREFGKVAYRWRYRAKEIPEGLLQ